jgi:hypothetical protein
MALHSLSPQPKRRFMNRAKCDAPPKTPPDRPPPFKPEPGGAK